MRRLFPKVFLLFVFLSIATSVVVVYGRRQTMSEHMSMFHLTDCSLPCWVGIQPGKTTIDEARELVLKTYPNFILINEPRSGGCLMRFEGNKYVLTVQFYNRDCEPDELTDSFDISINTADNSGRGISVGELYYVLGEPEILLSDAAGAPYPLLQYGQYHIWVRIALPTSSNGSSLPDCHALRPELSVFNISIRRALPTESDLRFRAQIWKGFRSCYVSYERSGSK